MKNIRERIKNSRLVKDMNGMVGLFGMLLIGPLFKLITLVIVLFAIFWILNNLVSIAIGIALICIPIFLMIVGVILVKQYLLRKKEGVKT
jgi:hypothetical protein